MKLRMLLALIAALMTVTPAQANVPSIRLRCGITMYYETLFTSDQQVDKFVFTNTTNSPMVVENLLRVYGKGWSYKEQDIEGFVPPQRVRVLYRHKTSTSIKVIMQNVQPIRPGQNGEFFVNLPMSESDGLEGLYYKQIQRLNPKGTMHCVTAYWQL